MAGLGDGFGQGNPFRFIRHLPEFAIAPVLLDLFDAFRSTGYKIPLSKQPAFKPSGQLRHDDVRQQNHGNRCIHSDFEQPGQGGNKGTKSG